MVKKIVDESLQEDKTSRVPPVPYRAGINAARLLCRLAPNSSSPRAAVVIS